MMASDFNAIVEARMDKVAGLLISKAEEYADDKERFANFKAVAAMNGETPEQALWGMVSKHVISVRDMMQNPETITQHLVDEKIGDWITYGHLMEGLALERLAVELLAEGGAK